MNWAHAFANLFVCDGLYAVTPSSSYCHRQIHFATICFVMHPNNESMCNQQQSKMLKEKSAECNDEKKRAKDKEWNKKIYKTLPHREHSHIIECDGFAFIACIRERISHLPYFDFLFLICVWCCCFALLLLFASLSIITKFTSLVSCYKAVSLRGPILLSDYFTNFFSFCFVRVT